MFKITTQANQFLEKCRHFNRSDYASASLLSIKPIVEIKGIWVPIITPFKNGSIDIPALKNLALKISTSGVDGLVVCGTTGEAAHLSDQEQETILRVVLETVSPGFPVMMGVSGADTLTVTNKIKHFNQFKVYAYLVSAPYYIRPSQAGVVIHFQMIADASAYPIVIYNIPARTGVNIELSSLIKLAENPTFVAIKESSNNINQIMDTINQTSLKVLCGDDSLFLQTMCAGGVGTISATAQIVPELYVDIYRQIQNSDLFNARRQFNQLLPLIHLLFSEPNPAPIKAILSTRGDIHDELRLPMLPATTDLKEKLLSEFDKLKLQYKQKNAND